MRDMRTADINDIKMQSSLPKCFIMTLTMKDCDLPLKLFYEIDECLLIAIRNIKIHKIMYNNH